ncbi:MAG: TetR family transcriptional regulator [Polyangiales bacterium]
MARVTKEKAAENREALLDAAGRLFREHGIDGVGVADIGKAAGLTHGALYAHFPSKEALAAEAFTRGFERSWRVLERARAKRPATFEALLALLLSPAMRDALAMGCPLTASASEVGRQGSALSESYRNAFEQLVGLVDATLDPKLSGVERRRLALTAVAAEVGAIAVSRALTKADGALSDEVLRAVRDTLESAAVSGQPPVRARRRASPRSPAR